MGYRAKSSTTGQWAHSSTIGDWACSSTTGKNSIATALGNNGKAKAGEGGAITLAHFNEQTGELIAVGSCLVGKNGIKPDTWYTLDCLGQFVECEDEE